MTSILFLTENIWRNQSEEIILKTKSFFSTISCIFEIYMKSWTFSKKKMSFIADLFVKLCTPKNVDRYLSKKSRFKGLFDKQHSKRVQKLLRSGSQHLYHI